MHYGFLKVCNLYQVSLFVLNILQGSDKYRMTCINIYINIIQNSFTALKIPCASPIHSSPCLPEPLATMIFLGHSFAFSKMSCKLESYSMYSLFSFASLTWWYAFKVPPDLSWLDSLFLFIVEQHSSVEDVPTLLYSFTSWEIFLMASPFA